MISSVSRTVLGVAIGTTLTMEVITTIPSYIPTLLIVPVYDFLDFMCWVSVFQERVLKYDRPTAYYASMPGGLQDMIVFGIEAGGNPRTLSLVHATRSLVLVTIAPIVLTQIFELELGNPLVRLSQNYLCREHWTVFNRHRRDDPVQETKALRG